MQYSIQIDLSFWYQIQKILFSPMHVQLTMVSQYKRENNQKRNPKNTHHNFGHTCSLLQLHKRNNCTDTNFGVRESRWEQWPLKASIATSSKELLQGTSGKKEGKSQDAKYSPDMQKITEKRKFHCFEYCNVCTFLLSIPEDSRKTLVTTYKLIVKPWMTLVFS